MKLRLHQFDLPLRHTFTISRGSIDVQPTLIVELEEDGLRGYGEATTNDYYGITFDSMTAALEGVRSQIESQSLNDPASLWQELDPELHANRFAQCALDQAAYDLWGKRLGQPVYRLWGLDAERIPLTNYTIGIDDRNSYGDNLHTDALHLVERLRRVSHDTIQGIVTVDDPKAHTRPWTEQTIIYKLKPGWRLYENVNCDHRFVKKLFYGVDDI